MHAYHLRFMLQCETPPLSLYVEHKDRQIPIATMIFKTFGGENNERERERERERRTCQRKFEGARQNSGQKSVTRNHEALLCLFSLFSASSSSLVHQIYTPQTPSNSPSLTQSLTHHVRNPTTNIKLFIFNQ
jgi:hypothetical protein